MPEYQIFEFLNAGSPSESLKGGYISKCMYVLKSLKASKQTNSVQDI